MIAETLATTFASQQAVAAPTPEFIEFERKFLIKPEAQAAVLAAAFQVDEIEQGYFMQDNERCVRIRKRANGYELTLKANKGIVGKVDELNTPFDEPQGLALMALCTSRVKKHRHLVQLGEFLWEIDLFLDHNSGLVLAEVELDDDAQSARLTAELPDWVAEEVTGNPRYFNTWLAQNTLSGPAPLAPQEPAPELTQQLGAGPDNE